MASPTIVDQLIVKLGLDPSNFTKGQKVAAAEVVKTEKQVKKSSNEMSASIASFSKKLLGIASVAVVVKKTLGYVSDLSTQVRQLGVDSRNFNIAANEMKNFQNVGEMFGGKAEQVTQTIGNITKAVYDLAYNGQISDSLIMLGRLGVEFQDTAGNAREFKDIILDTEKAIQTQMKNGGLTRANANQMLAPFIDPGLTQAILAGKVGESLTQQRARRQVTQDVVDVSTQWEQSKTNRDQAVEAAALRVLPGQAQAGIATNETLAGVAEKLSNEGLMGVVDNIEETLKSIGEKIKDGAESLVEGLEAASVSLRPKGYDAYKEGIQRAADKYSINPAIIAGILKTESNFDPAAKNPSGAVGIAQLMPSAHPDRKVGVNPFRDIDTAAEDVAKLYTDLEKKGFKGQDLLNKTLQSYNAGEQRVLDSLKPGGKPLAKETIDYPSKVLGYAEQAVPSPNAQSQAGTSNTSTVNISELNVNTQAKDADGIGRSITKAIKFNAAQADVGTQ